MKNTFPIGLTGGIASGKSMAATILSEKLGITLVCADTISREASKNKTFIKKMTDRYGDGILLNKQLNRAKLREIITESKEDKKWLEETLHPIIRREIRKQVRESETEFTIVDIPLFTTYNKKEYDFLKKIIVMKADFETRVARLIERDKKNRQQAVAFINLQISDTEREKLADYTIDNSSLTEEELENELKTIINNIKGLD